MPAMASVVSSTARRIDRARVNRASNTPVSTSRCRRSALCAASDDARVAWWRTQRDRGERRRPGTRRAPETHRNLPMALRCASGLLGQSSSDSVRPAQSLPMLAQSLTVALAALRESECVRLRRQKGSRHGDRVTSRRRAAPVARAGDGPPRGSRSRGRGTRDRRVARRHPHRSPRGVPVVGGFGEQTTPVHTAITVAGVLAFSWALAGVERLALGRLSSSGPQPAHWR